MQKTVINDEKLKNHRSSNSTIQVFTEYCGQGTVIVPKITVSILPEEISKKYSHKQKIPVYITCSERSKHRKIF